MNSSAQTVLGYLRSFLSPKSGEKEDDRQVLHRFMEARDSDAFAPAQAATWADGFEIGKPRRRRWSTCRGRVSGRVSHAGTQGC